MSSKILGFTSQLLFLNGILTPLQKFYDKFSERQMILSNLKNEWPMLVPYHSPPFSTKYTLRKHVNLYAYD